MKNESMPILPIGALWAKKDEDLWLPLVAHMMDAAEVALWLWDYFLPYGVKKQIASGITLDGDSVRMDVAKRILVFLAGAHDLGKASPIFQSKPSFRANMALDELLRERIREAGFPLKEKYLGGKETKHALVSHVILTRNGFSGSCASILSSHHGIAPSDGEIDDLDDFPAACGFNNRCWKNAQDTLLDIALENARLVKTEIVAARISQPVQVLINAVVILADWIASSIPLVEIDEYVPSSKKRVRGKMEELALTEPWKTEQDWDDLYYRRFDIETPYAVQTELLEVVKHCGDGPSIFIIEAPMGEGKTEAALAAAEVLANIKGRGGVFFALPTQATANAMYSRVYKWMLQFDNDFDTLSIRLAHGKAKFFLDRFTMEDDESIVVNEWLSGKKGMLSDFVIGTIDHLLMAGLKQKHVMLRHLGLANKVVIVDECHAYDTYMSSYLFRALNWLGAYGVPVIVLSATLPASTRQKLVEAYLNKKKLNNSTSLSSRAYPLITYTDNNELQPLLEMRGERALEITVQRSDDGDIVQLLEERLADGGCAGIIVNTVDRAQSFYANLKNRFGVDTVRLLHARFIAPDRAEKEGKLLGLLGPPSKSERPQRLIVVGTQVFEQSMDLDFDILITDIAPMDLLLQRIGRLWRHEKRQRLAHFEKPVCVVLGTGEAGFDLGAEAVYGKYLLMRTDALLTEKITLPGDISSLVQTTYDDDWTPEFTTAKNEIYEDAKKKKEKTIHDQERRAKDFQLRGPNEGLGTLLNLMSMRISDSSEKRGEATVRDGTDSIEVLVMHKRDERIYLLPWIQGGREIPKDRTPDDALAKALASCTVRLPALFGQDWVIDKAIKELETIAQEAMLEAWQRSHWLRGELYLVLDESLATNLCGHKLRYDRDLGLILEKGGGKNG